MKNFCIGLLCVLAISFGKAQSPVNITFPNPTSIPPNIAAQQFTRATQSIKLVPGSGAAPNPNYGFISGGAQNLLNLHISSYPPHVNNSYSPLTIGNIPYNYNTSLDALCTMGVPDVSNSGTFLYRMPIVCSPGTNGMQPNLEIEYASENENSFMGIGFNLNGLQSIRRGGKTIFHDGAIGGVKFDNNDVFYCNGQRLLIKSGTYGSAGSTYKTEVENYSQIEALGNFGSGPSSFSIKNADGITVEFGNSSDSRCTDVGGTEVLAWYVSRIFDSNGNFMTFSYSNSNGEILLTKISYTGNLNNNLSPYQEIEFKYINRSDDVTFRINGKAFNRSKLLSEITSKDLNGAVVRKYLLKYQFRLASQLKEITEVNGDGQQLNPTVFSWNAIGQVAANGCSSIVSITQNTCSISIPIDFNGDGFKDLILFRNQNDFAFTKVTNQTVPNCSRDFRFPTTPHVVEGTAVKYLGYTVLDDDDDNIEELFLYYTIPSGTNQETLKIIKIDHNPTMNITVEHTEIYGYSTTTFSQLSILNPIFRMLNSSRIYFNKADVTGDNQLDRIITDEDGLLIDVSSNATPVTIATNNILKTQVGDFDGDGVNDLFLLRYSSTPAISFYVEVLKYNPGTNALNSIVVQNLASISNPNMTNWSSPQNFSSLILNTINCLKSIDFGDFDGDGKTDIMGISYLNNSSGLINILKSDGINFLADPNPLPVSNFLNGFEALYSVFDVNLDGLSDIMVTSYDNVNKDTHMGYYASIGNKIIGPFSNQTFNSEFLFACADFTGDGTLDIVTQTHLIVHKMVRNLFEQHPKELVTRIENMKDLVDIRYGYLTEYAGEGKVYYQKVLPALNNEPGFRLKRPEKFVVTKLTINESVHEYGYKNPIYHRSGKGFLGFEGFYVSHRVTYPNSPTTRTTIDFDPIIDDVVSIDTDESNSFMDNIFVYYQHEGVRNIQTSNYVTTGTNRYLSSTTLLNRNYVASTCYSTNTNYDNTNYGNVLNSTTKYLLWNTTTVIRSIAEAMLYQTYTNPFSNVPLLRNVQSTKTLSNPSGASSFVRSNTYDAQGRLITTVENSNLSQVAVTTNLMQYNAFGIPCSTSVSAPDLTQVRNATSVYDATGRYILQSINAQGMTSSFQVEPKFGKTLTITSPGGQSESFDYDGWGRLTKTKSSTGAINTVKYDWYVYNPVSTPLQTLYGLKTTTTFEAGGYLTVFSDRRGNQVKTETIGFNSTPASKQTVYDSRDRVVSDEELHYNTQQLFKKVTYAYDQWDRTTVVQEKMNNNTVLSTINYLYNNLSTETAYNKGYVLVEKPTTNATINYKKTECNEAGQITTVKNYENPGNQHIINYTYNVFGLPTQVQTNFPGGQGNGVTNLTYDALGRRSSITDQSSGTHSFQYNSIGELISTSSPGSAYTMSYDNLGRLINRTGSSSGTFLYEYFTTGSEIGALKKITGPIELTERKYDIYGRLVEDKRSFNTGSGSKQFISQISYDKYNRLKTYKYPNTITLDYEYDNTGEMKKIKKGNQTLWELKSMKTPALPESYDIGSGLLVQNTYNSKLEIQQNAVGNIYSQTFAFNSSTGNLTNRTTQNIMNATSNNESFEFDNFDRLQKVKTTVGANVVTKQNLTYYDNGNIDTKDDCGSYQYGNTNQPYTLTQVQNQQNTISLNTLNFAYNDLQKITQLTEASTNKQFDFFYGNNSNRIQMNYKVNGQIQYSRFYGDGYEREESGQNFREWAYVSSPVGITGVFYNKNGVTNYYDITSDQNGSPVMLSNGAGQVAEEQSFDAWGRRRNPANWTFNTVPNPQMMIRGYGFHEHLDELGLINMNGRLYEPVLGRFVQADPLIQEPDNAQNYNRYSYVCNNPVNYSDPSGYSRVSAGSGLGREGASERQRNPWAGSPSLFVDGMRVDAGDGGYAFFLGGGAGGVATTHYMEVGGGAGYTGVRTSLGALLDQGKLFKSEDKYVNVSPKDYERKNGLPEGSRMSRVDGAADIETEYYVDQEAVDAAQSGGSTPQDFRIYTQPDPVNMSTNPDGNLVVATLIAAFQFENANPDGGQSRRMSTYLTNARGVTFNYLSIDFVHRGGRFRMNNLTLTFDGAGNLSWTSPGNGIAPLNQQFNEALRVRDKAFLNWQGQPVNNTQALFINYGPGFEFLPK